jgi:acyl-CoA reductase-like NAD-dependent aldehyde dehydrogenase
MANSCPGKLAAYVFSANLENAMEVGKQLATGMIMINGVHTEFIMAEGESPPSMHFWNSAGFGVDGTIHDIMNFFSRRRLIGPNGL